MQNLKVFMKTEHRISPCKVTHLPHVHGHPFLQLSSSCVTLQNGSKYIRQIQKYITVPPLFIKKRQHSIPFLFISRIYILIQMRHPGSFYRGRAVLFMEVSYRIS